MDLLTGKPIAPPYLKKNIEATKRLIYDRESKKVSDLGDIIHKGKPTTSPINVPGSGDMRKVNQEPDT